MKDGPAFQLYAKEFLVGTAHMSADAVGGFMRLLCYQWENGGILNTDDMLIALTRCRIDAIAEIRPKFTVSKKDGLLRNKKLEKIRKNQRAFRAVKSRNAKNGWSKRRSADATALQEHMRNTCSPVSSLQSPSPEDTKLRERAQQSVDRPSLAEVLDYAQSPHCGLAAWKAEDWFDEMQGCGWLDHNHRPIGDWRAVLRRVRKKWEADGRPAQPPKSNAYASGVNKPNPRNAGTVGDPSERQRAIRAKLDRENESRNESM